jgi:hypothetical protein
MFGEQVLLFHNGLETDLCVVAALMALLGDAVVPSDNRFCIHVYLCVLFPVLVSA